MLLAYIDNLTIINSKEILATKTTPSRTFYIDEPNVKEIRSKFSLNRNKFWKYFRCKK